MVCCMHISKGKKKKCATPKQAVTCTVASIYIQVIRFTFTIEAHTAKKNAKLAVKVNLLICMQLKW